MPTNTLNTMSYGQFNASINLNVSTPTSQPVAVKEDKSPPAATKIYGKSWIVIQNRLVHAISNLDKNERRLVLFLSPIVRTTVDKNPDSRTFIVNANDFAAMFNLNNNNYYQTVRDTAKSLQSKSFTFWEFHKNAKRDLESSVSWIGKTTYMPYSSMIEVTLMDDVINMLSVFDRSNPYTRYQKNLIANLSTNGMILLELVASFEDRRSKQETYTTEYIREKFGCVDTYSNIAEFKRNVLDTAVKELREKTPYIVSHKSSAQRGGRTITHFTFNVKKQGEIAIPAISTSAPKKTYKKGLTAKQIAKISIHKTQFVDLNQHMIEDPNLDTYQAFESFKPLLSDKATVNNFEHIDDFLSVTPGGAAPSVKPIKKPTPQKPTKPNKSAIRSFTPTAEDIKIIAANPAFQKDYPVNGQAVGSDGHRKYLEFRLSSNLGEFTKAPLQTYIN